MFLTKETAIQKKSRHGNLFGTCVNERGKYSDSDAVAERLSGSMIEMV